MEDIHIEFMVEKKDGFGEDSEPLSFHTDDRYAVGVFDGMGGSGASKGAIKDIEEEHSQAYFASRLAKDAVSHLLESTEDVTSESLKNAIMQHFKEKIAGQEIASRLRSNLLRSYPTTMAFVLVETGSETDYSIKSFWAGDSRNYLWTETGFYQISNDDLRDNRDPYENLKNDDVLSNCITSNGRFEVNELCIKQHVPFIVLSATDGCFGYLKAPMYFERILKDTLKEADDEKDWGKRIVESIQSVAADDISLALRAVGFDNFNELKERFCGYEGGPFKDIDGAFEDVKNAEHELIDASRKYEEKLISYWQQYKVKYMKYVLPEEANCAVQHSPGRSDSKHEEETVSENNDDAGPTSLTDSEYVTSEYTKNKEEGCGCCKIISLLNKVLRIFRLNVSVSFRE